MIHEQRLISAVVNNQDIAPVINGNNVDSLFTSHKDIWDFCKDYYYKYRAVTPKDILEERFQEFSVIETTGNVKHYLDQLRDGYQRTLLSRIARGLASDLDGMNTNEAISRVQNFMSEITKSSSNIKDLDITDHGKALDHYTETQKRMRENGGVLGIKFGYDSIDANYPTGAAPGQYIMVLSRTAQGKRLRVDESIPTPTGWTTMGELRVGDQVIGSDGKSCNVTALSEIENDPDAWKLIFSDGSSIEADAEHQWSVLVGCESEPTVMTTADISKALTDNKLFIPTVKPVDIEAADTEEELENFGLSEKYLRVSLSKRKACLDSIMRIFGVGQMDFFLHRESDVRIAVELAYSLGYLPAAFEAENGLLVSLSNPHPRQIASVVKTEPSPMRCITVDSPDHTYVASRNWIVTHNSWIALDFAINAWAQGKKVLYISLEMSPQVVRDRAYTLMSKGDFRMSDLSRAQIDLSDLSKWTESSFEDNKTKFIVTAAEGMGGFSPNNLQTKIDQYEPDIAFVDYIQLMDDNKGSNGETDRVRSVSRELKALAMSADIPIVAIAAASSNETKEYNSPPQIYEVAQSRQSAFDCDLVLSLISNKQKDGTSITEMVSRKNRMGPDFDFVLKMDVNNGKIEEHWEPGLIDPEDE